MDDESIEPGRRVNKVRDYYAKRYAGRWVNVNIEDLYGR